MNATRMNETEIVLDFPQNFYMIMKSEVPSSLNQITK